MPCCPTSLAAYPPPAAGLVVMALAVVLVEMAAAVVGEALPVLVQVQRLEKKERAARLPMTAVQGQRGRKGLHGSRGDEAGRGQQRTVQARCTARGGRLPLPARAPHRSR